MYKLLKHEEKEYPIRISNVVLGEWQEETGKSEIKNMTFKDMFVLLKFGLKAGFRFAKKLDAKFADAEFELDDIDIELMIDNPQTVERFLTLIPTFFNQKKTGKKAGDPGKS